MLIMYPFGLPNGHQMNGCAMPEESRSLSYFFGRRVKMVRQLYLLNFYWSLEASFSSSKNDACLRSSFNETCHAQCDLEFDANRMAKRIEGRI